MRILFCGDTFPAASQVLKRRFGLNEIVICLGDRISKALDGVGHCDSADVPHRCSDPWMQAIFT